MTIAELCTIESGIFLNGVFGVVEQGAMSISLQIDWCLYVITLGLGVACSIRVGHNLGAGDGQGAKTAFRVALFTLFCLNFVTTILLVSLKDVAGLLFTSDRDVVEMVSKILPILIVVQASDVVYGVCSGALRGCGQQWKGGVLNFVGYCFISVPAIVVFMFYTKLGALGFWWGIVAGMVPIAVVYVIIVFRIDWQKEAVKASRDNKEVLDTSLTTKSDSTITEFGARDFRKVPSEENHICDEDKELSQPISQKSTEDTSLIDNDKTSGRRKPHLIFTRLLTCGVVIVILVASICVRLFVKS
ncbi:multidrug and toxin extrusion protein 1-like [Liolophura sinensis]|uniref:multidrug and toxin extrusion protein 1-like n=1 Tax=Liolophura sinensis TaxID=3198878 RepID=UPI00315828CE